MAPNPNPSRISDAIWRLWTEFDAIEPSAQLGGVYAAKGGYHNYRAALPSTDYSVEDVAADRRGSSSKASAIDLTLPDAAMRKYTGRLDVAARARDPRLYSNTGPVLREFIGTKDNRTVYCYVLVGGRPLGVGADAGEDPGRDESHLWHVHLSIIRQFCEDWPALDGVLSVLRGESLAAWRARTEGDDVTRDELREDLARLLQALTYGDNAVFSSGAHPWLAGAVTLPKLAAELRLSHAALLAAVQGADGAAILARIEELAAAEAARDAALPAELADRLTGPIDAAVREALAGVPGMSAEQIEAAVANVVGRVRIELDTAPQQ